MPRYRRAPPAWRTGRCHFRWRIGLKQVFVVLIRPIVNNKSARAGDRPSDDGHTCRIFSMLSSRFAFRMRCASSTVIRCSRVSLSVNDPVVAFPTPATSDPIAPCGRCFASAKHECLGYLVAIA
jgi:hypothetical protein